MSLQTPILFLATILSAVAAPLGVFDFDLRGADPAEQIRGIDDIGFEGITMFLNSPAEIERLNAFQAAKPDLKLIAGLIVVDLANAADDAPTDAVIQKLADTKAKLWLIVKGSKADPAAITARIAAVADRAAAKGVEVSIYPHDNTAIETAEEALVHLRAAARPKLTLSVHLCHELRAGNGHRLHEVLAAVRPHLDLVSISGSNVAVNDNSEDWSDAIKPLGEGDYDPRHLLRALKANHFDGTVILHTFGLKGHPASHYRNSFARYQEMHAEVARESRRDQVMKRPLRVDTSQELPFDSDRVWRLNAGFDTLPDYHASITTSELSEGGVVRKIGLTEAAGGGHVVERLVHFDDHFREFSYRITDLIDCRFPLRDYQAFVRLESTGPGRSRLHWGSAFKAEGVSDAEADELARVIYQGCYDGIHRVLEKEDRDPSGPKR